MVTMETIREYYPEAELRNYYFRGEYIGKAVYLEPDDAPLVCARVASVAITRAYRLLVAGGSLPDDDGLG